jgi:hypothetical protein
MLGGGVSGSGSSIPQQQRQDTENVVENSFFWRTQHGRDDASF